VLDQRWRRALSEPFPVASSVDALVAGATSREPLTRADSKSGARIERVAIDGEAFVLKHVDRADDWIMRQTGDVGCWPVRVWESGVLDLLPPCIDHTLVGAARTAHGGAVLMRDVGACLVDEGDAPLPYERHERFLAHLAAFHAATWGWRDDVGLLPSTHRYLFFLAPALECEAALGFPSPVPRIATEGWARLEVVDPHMHAALRPLLDDPWPLVDAVASTPTAFLHGDWKLGNLGSTADGRTVLVDWSVSGSGAPLAELAHYLALNTARLPDDFDKDVAIESYRDALEAEGVDTEPWWDRQLGVCLLGVMLLLGWEKALDDEGSERAWWSARVDEGLAWL
jgi:hypothetical protein